MPKTQRGAFARPMAVPLLIIATALGLTACSSNSTSSGRATSSSTTRAVTSTSGVATTTTSANMAGVNAAINAYEVGTGLSPSQYTVANVEVSTVDPTWVRFSIEPSATDQDTFQSAYGFAHLSGGTWRVTGIGSSGVGCPLTPPTDASAATYVAVPAAVLAGFQQTCPG